MANYSRPADRPSELMPLAEALLHRAAGIDERMPAIRTGERQPIHILVRQLVHRRDEYRCLWCGASPWARDKDRRCSLLHLDHIVPWSAGGSDRSGNLRTLCDSCNGYRSNYRTDMFCAVVIPVVGICDPCIGRLTVRPTETVEVFCGCHSYDSWVADWARVL